MRRWLLLAFGIVVTSAAGCGKSPDAPAALDLSGTWTGTASDPQGNGTLSWTVTQNGATLAGPVASAGADPLGTTCASCHKVKVGELAGTLAQGRLTLTMSFPTGGDVPTPICSVTINAVADTLSDTRIVANYSGGDSCEGPFVNGAFTMTRKSR